MPVELRVVDSLATVDAAAWDALVGDDCAFLEWGWLASLEESGCVAPDTGWLPQHLTLWEDGRLIGACPLYVKGHSQGEFVFDHGWADAAHRAGIRYYPKLLVAVPFTPAAGSRFLALPDVDRGTVARTLGAALKQICAESGFSSAHVNFCLPEEVGELQQVGFVHRTGLQFQWINPGWQSFDDYLAAFRSKRRVQIKRERRELDDQGIVIRTYAGDDIDDELMEPMFRLYKSTIDKLYWGRQYLTLDLFRLLAQRWKHRLCFFLALKGEQILAGTFCVRKGDVLYGRYWGTFRELRHLHFNVCYYASIEYCLVNGLRRFEPGAGGEFKHLRGFDARPTHSMHWVAEPRFARAVKDHLARERHAVADEIEWYGEHSAIKK